jgi:hypothetical protein
MSAIVTKVREIPDVGFEVERDSPTSGRLVIGFSLFAEGANDIARESFDIDRLLHVDGPVPAPVLELWEGQA